MAKVFSKEATIIQIDLGKEKSRASSQNDVKYHLRLKHSINLENVIEFQTAKQMLQLNFRNGKYFVQVQIDGSFGVQLD